MKRERSVVHVHTAKDIGTCIRDQRKRQKLDQATLASLIGVNRRWVMEVERGKPRAEIGLVLKTLEALGLDLSVDRRDAFGTTVDAIDIVDIDAIVRNAKGPAA